MSYEVQQIGPHTLYRGDALEVLPLLNANAINLIATDPPFFKVKDDSWDRQWDKPAEFLGWMNGVLEQFARVLAPNGSLYAFASPKMAARVEVLIAERFNVLNRITWKKDAGWAKRQCKEEQRAYFPASEAIIFAEHYGADGIAKGEAGYSAKCDELRGFVFEPLRAYLASERDKAGLTTRKIAEAYQKKTGSRTVTGMAGHWFERVQWSLPTKENYEWLRETMSLLNHGGKYLRREYEDLRREYEDLRREYEDLRRPFSVSAGVPHTDVWTFPTVQAYSGKHPCEKPIEMMEHITQASSRCEDVVLDSFMGSGTTGVACQRLGRKFIGIEIEPKYFDIACKRIEKEMAATPLLEMAS